MKKITKTDVSKFEIDTNVIVNDDDLVLEIKLSDTLHKALVDVTAFKNTIGKTGASSKKYKTDLYLGDSMFQRYRIKKIFSPIIFDNQDAGTLFLTTLIDTKEASIKFNDAKSAKRVLEALKWGVTKLVELNGTVTKLKSKTVFEA